MGVLDRLRGHKEVEFPYEIEDLDTVLRTHEIIEATDGYLLVEKVMDVDNRPVRLYEGAVPAVEMGTTRSIYSGVLRDDYNPELRGHLGLQKYVKMKRSDSTVRASLLGGKTPILSASWYIQPYSNDAADVEVAEYVAWNFFQGMSTSFPQLLWELLLMLDYGYYTFEKVFKEVTWRGQDRIAWKKFAARHPLDLYEWVFDKNGGPVGAWFYGTEGSIDGVFIPIEYMAVFTHDREGGNIEGVSVLRSSYKNWFYKENLYKIDAIQKERHGIGIPIIKLPPGFSVADKQAAHEIGRNLRTNEKAHVVLPPNWDVVFAKLEGQPVNALESAKHHASEIFRNVLLEWLIESGASSNSADHKDMFLKSSKYIAEIARDVFNKYCIPQLVDMNWKVEGYPEMRVRRIGDTQDWRTLSFAVRNFIGAGVIQPDDELERWMREEMELPMADPSTKREVATPQMPRQAPASNQKLQSGRNAGVDGSGGK